MGESGATDGRTYSHGALTNALDRENSPNVAHERVCADSSAMKLEPNLKHNHDQLSLSKFEFGEEKQERSTIDSDNHSNAIGLP